MDRPPLRMDVLTLFPEMFDGFLSTSIPRRAAVKGLVEYNLCNIRDFATDAHQSVDDKPFGGGPGMVMMCGPLFDAVEAVELRDSRKALRIILSPRGTRLDQNLVKQLALRPRLLMVAGHYEGVDQRVIDGLGLLEISIGDYVLSGGELAAMVLMDAVVRLLPGALGAADGADEETFSGGLLEYPQYTRPREFRGLSVPEVLLSGNHRKIAAWRMEQRKTLTQQRRPDLWRAYLDEPHGFVRDKAIGDSHVT